VRGRHPSSDGWSEPRRRLADWTSDLGSDAEAEQSPGAPLNAQRSQGTARNGRQRNGHGHQGDELFPSQPWSNGSSTARSLSDEPLSGRRWSPDPSPGPPRGDEPAPGQPWTADPSPGQPWTADPSPGQPWTADPSPGQPWTADPSPSQPWTADPSASPRWGVQPDPGQARDAEQLQGQAWGVEPANAQRREDESSPGAARSLGELWGVQPIKSKALELAPPSRARRLAATPAYARLGAPAAGLRRNGRMTLVIAIPLVLSLLLLVMAGPGRVLPRKSTQDAVKRPAAAAVQPGDLNRLVTLVNQERARNGLPGMRVLRRLNAVATAHSAEMARQKRIQPDPGIAVSARPATSVSQYVDCASNIDQAFQRMIASATYRPLILSPILNGMGLGTVSGNCLWVTVLFARATPPASASKPAAPTGGGPLPQPAREQAVSVRDAPGRPSTTAEAIAQDLFSRANAERKARGLAPLEWSDDLARMASDWSSQMARSGRFVHRDLDAARGRPGIGQFSALGENIAWVRGYDDDGYELHIGWMRSEGHRRNLLQQGFDTIGIGVVCAGGRAWATQNFGRLSASAPPLSDSTPPTEPIVATAKDGRSC
jgi:uncharacterized protein YkwD